MVQEKIANRVILHRHFKDIDELAEVLNSGRKVQLTQLSLRRFNCDLFFVEFEEAQFSSQIPLGQYGAWARKKLNT
jgi:hypothetical protein